MLQVISKVAASLGLRINASKTEILSIDKDWKEGDVPVQQGPEVALLHFMICHSNKCHRPRTSSCHKEQRGGTEYG